MPNTILSKLIGGPIRQAVRRKRDSFLASTRDCARQQRTVLTRLLRLNADTKFAQDHGLGLKLSPDEFRSRVPVSDYDYHAPYIEAVKNGDHSALLGPTNKLLMFSLTSGTTSRSKFIPITSQFLSDYRRGWQFWGITAIDQYPELSRRSFFQLTGNHDTFRTASGTPCGNISGLVTAMQKPHVRALFSVPQVVSQIRDPDARRYVTMRMGLQDPNVGQILTANPATLVQLAEFANTHADRLLADIHNGTLCRAFPIEPAIFRSLRRHLKPRTRRARELARVIDADNGVLRPRSVWPHLQFLGVWTGGSASAYDPALNEWFGKLPRRDHGLHASEGRMTIPLRSNTSSGVLDTASHFFEFIPVAEEDAANPTVLLAHELAEGEDYFILLTTSSGLYRYHIRDVVRCTGFYNKTPELSFLHKGAHISSVTGEKISESQVVEAVLASASELGVVLKAFTLTPTWGTPVRYSLFVAGTSSPSETTRLGHLTDQRLSELNEEYADKRGSSRLGEIECVELAWRVWNCFREHRVGLSGATLEQYKHPCLLPDPQFEGLFEQQSGIRPREMRASA